MKWWYCSYIKAIGLAPQCCRFMLSDCNSLTSVKFAYTGSPWTEYDEFELWVDGVAQTGTFYYNGKYSAQDFGFPSGWEAQPF